MPELTCSAVLFDLDGVLVDSRAVVERTWRGWCERRGFDAAKVLEAAHGRRTVDTLRLVAPDLDHAAELRWLEEAELADREGIVAIPGAPELAASLPRDRWAVVTSAGRELAHRRLKWVGLPIPSCLVPAEAVSRGKPSPEGYLSAATELRVPPADCVVIEDSPAGVRAARAARMTVIGLTTTYGRDDLPPVDALRPDLRGIEARLDDGDVVLMLDE